LTGLYKPVDWRIYGVDWLVCAIETLRQKEEEKARADLLSADLANTTNDASQVRTLDNAVSHE